MFIYCSVCLGVSRVSLGVKEVVVIPKEEARELLRRLRTRPWQLPWIRSSDPLAQSAGAKPGDILKIVRESPTAGETVVHRLVVPG
jgi:DNA-directed RNA polymerase subunit H